MKLQTYRKYGKVKWDEDGIEPADDHHFLWIWEYVSLLRNRPVCTQANSISSLEESLLRKGCHWCDSIVLNACAVSDKCDDIQDSSCKELEHAFC